MAKPTDHRFVGINAGSGQRPFDQRYGWINLDIQTKSFMGNEPDVVGDMKHMPFPDRYADMVVSHHTLEHEGCGEADGFIDEAWRVLKHNGSLIICVPDMRALAQAYLMHNISTQLYMTNVYGAYMGNEADRHKWGYDSGSLHKYLTSKWSWCEVKQFNYRQIEGADIARDWWILALECVR